MRLSFSTVFTGLLIAQSIYASVVLIVGQKNRHANRYLGLLLFFSSLWLTDSFLRVSSAYESNPNLYFLPIFYSLGFGPLLFLYTRSITQRDQGLKLKDGLHFVPMVAQAMCYLFLSLSSYSFKRWFWLEVHRPYTYDLEFILTLFSLLGYGVLSINLIRRYQRWIREHYSEISKIHLNWTKYIHFLIIGLCCFWLLETVLRELFVIYADLPVSSITIGLGILILGTAGILQADVLRYGIDIKDAAVKQSESEPIDSRLLAFIKNEMLEKQLFLDPELTLRSFSEEIGLPPRQVSHYINQGMQSNYIDFVNTFRVDLVKKRLNEKAYAHLTLAGIALESGFNSKSTFNRVFKKITGQTPSEARKRGHSTS